MSSRALRRLQKEKLLLDTVSDDEVSDTEPVAAPAVQNLFDLLNEGDDNDHDDDDQDEHDDAPVDTKPSPPLQPVATSKKKKKKNKKKGLQVTEVDSSMAAEAVPAGMVVSKSKNKSKKKGKGGKGTAVEDLSMQDLDALLKGMDQKDSQATTTTTMTDATAARDDQHVYSAQAQSLLSIQARFLDAEAEMKRLFGSRVVNRESRPSGRLLKKTKLATPKVDWPMYNKQGLSMERYTAGNDENKDFKADVVENAYTFQHGGRYQDSQLMYLEAIERFDPNALVLLSRQHPYHIDTLLQLSEIAKQQGDWTVAGDCVERALYGSERALHPHFALGPGTARLAFRRSENRSFYTAIVRHIQFLTRRGCWRTAFEFNKLLLSLAPAEDPTGAILSIDYYALCAREYQYVTELAQHWQGNGVIYPKDMHEMPNIAFSAAYAYFKLDQMDDAIDALQQAIALFPGVAAALLEKLDAPVQLASRPMDDTLSLLTALYVDRAHQLWKEPEVLSWLSSTVSSMSAGGATEQTALSKLPVSRDNGNDDENDVPLNVCRHILFLDQRELLALLPRTVTQQNSHVNDPLPPSNSETAYEIQASTRRSGGWMDELRRLIGGLPPDIRRPFEQLVQARVAAALPAELNDRLPGTFPGAEHPDDDHPDNDHDQDHQDEHAQDAAAADAPGDAPMEPDWNNPQWAELATAVLQQLGIHEGANDDNEDIQEEQIDHDDDYNSDDEDMELQRALEESRRQQ
ncbi:transcriptional repressor TCF25-domain-containing protein [Gongronella butleri]|nr:transcriptional repressor TCF25-domain-containing protein [Gongronella butleri]